MFLTDDDASQKPRPSPAGLLLWLTESTEGVH